MQHKWVRHIIQEVTIGKPSVMGQFVVTPIAHTAQETLGCDACGLPLTVELFEEPCLAALEDQMEAEALSGEEGDDSL